MRTYTITSDRLIIGNEAPLQPSDAEVIVTSADELRAAQLSSKRLLALWNDLPGCDRLTRIGSRETFVDRLWLALEALPDPRPARPSKQADVIALLRRPEGATIEEVRTATGWQPHTVRGLFSGALRKKLGLTVMGAKEDRGRVYRIAAASV